MAKYSARDSQILVKRDWIGDVIDFGLVYRGLGPIDTGRPDSLFVAKVDFTVLFDSGIANMNRL